MNKKILLQAVLFSFSSTVFAMNTADVPHATLTTLDKANPQKIIVIFSTKKPILDKAEWEQHRQGVITLGKQDTTLSPYEHPSTAPFNFKSLVTGETDESTKNWNAYLNGSKAMLNALSPEALNQGMPEQIYATMYSEDNPTQKTFSEINVADSPKLQQIITAKLEEHALHVHSNGNASDPNQKKKSKLSSSTQSGSASSDDDSEKAAKTNSNNGGTTASILNSLTMAQQTLTKKLTTDQQAEERLAAEKARIAAEEKAKQEEIQKQQALDAEKAKQEKAEKLAKENAEKLAAEKLAAEKLAAEKLVAEKLAAEKLVAEKLAAEKLAKKTLAEDAAARANKRETVLNAHRDAEKKAQEAAQQAKYEEELVLQDALNKAKEATATKEYAEKIKQNFVAIQKNLADKQEQRELRLEQQKTALTNATVLNTLDAKTTLEKMAPVLEIQKDLEILSIEIKQLERKLIPVQRELAIAEETFRYEQHNADEAFVNAITLSTQNFEIGADNTLARQIATNQAASKAKIAEEKQNELTKAQKAVVTATANRHQAETAQHELRLLDAAQRRTLTTMVDTTSQKTKLLEEMRTTAQDLLNANKEVIKTRNAENKTAEKLRNAFSEEKTATDEDIEAQRILKLVSPQLSVLTKSIDTQERIAIVKKEHTKIVDQIDKLLIAAEAASASEETKRQELATKRQELANKQQEFATQQQPVAKPAASVAIKSIPAPAPQSTVEIAKNFLGRIKTTGTNQTTLGNIQQEITRLEQEIGQVQSTRENIEEELKKKLISATTIDEAKSKLYPTVVPVAPPIVVPVVAPPVVAPVVPAADGFFTRYAKSFASGAKGLAGKGWNAVTYPVSVAIDNPKKSIFATFILGAAATFAAANKYSPDRTATFIKFITENLNKLFEKLQKTSAYETVSGYEYSKNGAVFAKAVTNFLKKGANGLIIEPVNRFGHFHFGTFAIN